MAAEIVRTVLDAESEASKKIDKANEDARLLIGFTKSKADDELKKAVSEAKQKAETMLADAQRDADGLVRQAEKLAVLRDKKLIGEVEAKYSTAIDAVLAHIV